MTAEFEYEEHPVIAGAVEMVFLEIPVLSLLEEVMSGSANPEMVRQAFRELVGPIGDGAL